MAKKILLLFDKVAIAQEKAAPADLCKLLNGAANGQAEYFFACYENLEYSLLGKKASILEPETGMDIADFDLIYHRRWAFSSDEAVACSIYLDKKGVPFVDTELRRPGSSGKLSQYFRFWAHGLPIPKTIMLPNLNYAKLTPAAVMKHQLEMPFILKSTDASRGNDNFLIKDLAQVKKILKECPDTRFLIQEYIPNDGDYRVIVGNDELLMVIERKANGRNHKNNTSQGGSATLKPENIFSKQVESDIIKAARAFNRELSGVDLVFNKHSKKHYFFEVNRGPQIEGSSFPAKKAQNIHNFLMKAAK